MIIVLPGKTGKGAFNELKDALQDLDLTKLLEDMSPVSVTVQLPRFEISATVALREALPLLGVKDVFDAEAADLSGISNDSLFVSSSPHKARIKVDEKGTTAAASTAVEIEERIASGEPMSKTFIADHPFVFFIVDTTSEVILFMGDVRQFPTAL